MKSILWRFKGILLIIKIVLHQMHQKNAADAYLSLRIGS